MANNYVFKDNTELVLSAIAAATKEGAKKMADCAVESVQYQILYGYKDPHGKDGHTEIVDTGRFLIPSRAMWRGNLRTFTR